MINYEKLKTIGNGTYGKVMLCKKKKTGEKVAIKKVQISAMTYEDRQKALKEAQLLSSLKHPNIVECVDSFIEKCCLHIVMEYVDGGDLSQIIEKRRTPPEEKEVIRLLIQVIIAIQYIHKHKIIHRDIKPQNIFLTKEGVVKIGDFGISKSLDSTSALAKTCVGTPCYLAPEVWGGRAYDSKADMWSVGCVFFELCSLKKAFEGKSQKELVDKILIGRHEQIPVQYSSDLRHIIDGLMAMDPAKRPSAAQVLKLGFIRFHMEQILKEDEEKAMQKKEKEKKKLETPQSVQSDKQKHDKITNKEAVRQSITKLQLSRLKQNIPDFSPKIGSAHDVEKSGAFTGRSNKGNKGDFSSTDSDFNFEGEGDSFEDDWIDVNEDKNQQKNKNQNKHQLNLKQNKNKSNESNDFWAIKEEDNDFLIDVDDDPFDDTKNKNNTPKKKNDKEDSDFDDSFDDPFHLNDDDDNDFSDDFEEIKVERKSSKQGKRPTTEQIIEEQKTKLRKELGEPTFNQLYDDIKDEFSEDCAARVRAFSRRNSRAVRSIRELIDLEES